MRTIAIINQKGGCGKTTVAINLAAVLANDGHRTLLVDMDPQSHCALGLAVPESQIDCSMSSVLRAGLDGSIGMSDIVWQISAKLDLAPSAMDLAAIERALAGAPDRDQRLRQVLSTVADRYDYCIIDCPPSIGLLTFNALRAAREILIPVETGFFAMQGSVRQEATIEMLARRAGHQARFNVLPTLYDTRTKLSKEILTGLQKHFGNKLVPHVVHFNSKLKEAASFGQPITEYDPASRGMQDFQKVVQWLVENPPVLEDQHAERGADVDPAMSRAAELVTRAKALAERTSELAGRVRAGDLAGPLSHGLPQPPEPPDNNHPDNDPHEQGLPKQGGSIRERLSRLYGVQKTAQGLLFVQPAANAHQVMIAGDFNDWNPHATPMVRDASLGVWQTTITVPPGRYKYRLVVDGKWTSDPYNNHTESNPYGERDSVVEVVQNPT